MRTDLGMVLLDIICTFWESAMFVYLIHIFIKKKTHFIRDAIMMCAFVASAEIATFTGVNVLLKMMLLMICCVVSGIFIYRDKIEIWEILVVFNAFAFVQTGVEVCVSIAYELIQVEFHYEGLKYIYNQWQWYLIAHIFTSIMILLLQQFLVRLRKDITVREKIVLTLVFYGLMLLLIGIPADPIEHIFLYKIGMIIGVIILLIAVLILMNYFNESIKTKLKQQREEYQLQELQMQHQYYEERIKEEERVRRVYHDMKNHLLVIQAQLEDFENTDNRSENEERKHETEKMIQSLQHQIADYENYVQTGNAFLDVILRDKLKKAKEKKIDFHTEIDFTNGDFIDALDVSTIFGNALDNAIEACEKVSEEKRFITMKVRTKNNFLVIYLENSAVWEKMESTTTKEDVFLHGYGLKNIQWAVEKYGGQCKRDFQNDMYILSILLPITLK